MVQLIHVSIRTVQLFHVCDGKIAYVKNITDTYSYIPGTSYKMKSTCMH